MIRNLAGWVRGACLLAAFGASDACGEVRLPGFFGDHMVLQQQKEIVVWGWADAEETVSVTLGDAKTSVQADRDGRWRATLPPREASTEPLTLTVACPDRTLTINDVLIGEVWLCSGQSNMEWTVGQSSNAAEEIAAARFPLIRQMKAAHRPSTTPLPDLDAAWQVCSPETVGNFTGVGYFMARRLHQELGVPVGLINSSWGGTRVEPWTPLVGFQKVEALADITAAVLNRTPASLPYRQALGQHIAALEDWIAEARKAMETMGPIAPSPAFPAQMTPFTSHQDPTMLYNGMIHALVGYPIRGAIWYQGESNHVEGMLYFQKKKALIQGWRELWGQGDFPFYYVQIAPFQYGEEDPEVLARFWEAQAAVQQLPNTAMVVINDIATLNDIHPPNKQDVGARLAMLALKHDYGRQDVVAHSPEYEALQADGGTLRVRFRNTGGGLKTRDGKAPTHFEIIGPGSEGFQPAVARIDGDTVVLTSDKVQEPTAFRFAWHKLAEPNLTGGTGLPVGACRAGDVPEFSDRIPHASQYRLVYDLDLGNLSGTPRYEQDLSGSVGQFDRVAYFLQLEKQDGVVQHVFVSMNAFTTDAAKIGVPTFASGASFQQNVEAMSVYSDVEGLVTGEDLRTGNIEFWPDNYGPANVAGVPNASGSVYDFGDQPSPPRNGYGCMQVHNHAAKQTVFAINHWGQGATADIGIGNSAGQNRDWTFAGNAGDYAVKRLQVLVRPR